MPKRKQGEVDNQGVQDFELIELLIREKAGVSQPGPSTSAPKGSDFESFKARFQSYVDQVPSYLHSVGKEGFFPHFFLGSFSTLIDTEIATKLNIEKVYFSFDSAKTLKVAVIKNGEIKNPEDAADKVKLFVVAESGSTKKKFSYGELDKILGNTKVTRNEVVRRARDQGKLGVKLVEITKEMAGISVDVKSNNLDKDTSAIHEFKEIKKGLWSNPESDIAKLTNSNAGKVKESVEEIFKKVSRIHSEHENSLVYANQAREAAHHGFIAGALVNFRYRHNLRVYLEQFAGRGYADIVLVPRGKDRSLNAVPIIIELKAGTSSGTTPNNALEQAKDYAKGFQPNTMRVLTVSDNVLCVGLNLDSTEKFSTHISPREDREIAPPTIQKLLEVTSSWNGERSTITDITEKIKQPLERIYHTFPGTPEKGGNYFSRFLLGQLLLANEFKRIKLEKSVFLYNEYPLASSTRSGAQSTERPVTTFMLTKGNQGQDKEVFIFHIREGGKGEFSGKKIPINLPTVSKITEACISLQEERKSDFFNVEKIDRYNSLNEYKQGKSFFAGEWKNIPYPAELKETFDKTLESQHTPQSSSTAPDSDKAFGNYKGLLEKIGEGILPLKPLIEKEAHFQAVLHGAFSHYSDIKLGESQENRALVLTEFQTGRGKRIDMVVHGIKFADQASSAKEYDPVGLELKGPREGKTADALVKEANDQINTEYVKGVTYKTLTDGKEVDFVGVVFDKEASDGKSLILMSKDEFASVKVIHSSIFSFSQQQTKKKFNLNRCVKQSSRSKRSVGPCLFSKDDVEKFSKVKVDENNVDKVIIDSEKFLTYIKSSQDEGKNAQLIEFIGNKNIEGDYKYLVDKAVGDQGYERYIQNERIKDLQGDVLQQNSGLTKNPKLKSRLMNAAGGIQLIRGIHGAIVSCKDGTATDCGLNLGGVGWSFASQPIENVMVKITPRVVTSAEKVVGKIIPGTLGKQTKFVIRVAGVKFGSTVAKGVAGAVGGVFDIIDIGISANNLVDCKNRESSDNPCGEKEIRDNIASISFSGVSFVSGVALTAAGMPVVGIAVGFGLMVGYGVYSGVSNIVEYEKKYDTTHGENWSIFWRTILFQDMASDVQHLADRKNTVDSLAKEVWKALNNAPNSVVAYGVGLGKVSDNTLRPDYAKILMDKEDTSTKDLSRVIPDRIPGASRICLPKVTGQDYEKGITSSVQPPLYYCENAMVISHDSRVGMEQSGKTIVYDLQNVDNGVIVGSNKWNNNFLIYPGTTKITGGNNVANRFVLVNNPSFLGKIIGGSNSINILDLSQLAEDKVIGVIDYRFKPSAYGQLKIRINSRLLIDDCVSNNLFNYHYIGRQNKVDEVLCMGDSEHFTESDNRDVIIDNGGGLNRNRKDVVENCRKVIISPYTTVKGGKSNYTFYVKTADYKGKGLYSEINVDGTGTVVFPEIDLLSDCDQITYSKESNTLSLKINFGQNNQFTLDVKNYVEQSSKKPHFVLIDKNGSNIVPKIERSDSATIKINSFELHSEHSLGNFKDVETHYKKILNDDKDYKVLSVIRGKTQSQDNIVVPHMVFGSSGDDVINFDQGTMFARGGKGRDVYVIADDINNKEVKIDNNSDDEKMDTLFIPEVEKGFSIQQCDLHLNYSNISIQVKNYLQDHNHRHFIIMNKKGEAFIPNIQSMSCSSSGEGKLVPFLQATQTQNMFLLPKDFADDHVVIDSRLEDIEKYKDKDDLLLIRESEIPFIIRIEGFYTDRSKWENISYSLWNNNDLFPSPGLLGNIDNVMEYKDKLRDDYKKVVKEYIIDFSNSTNIEHNQKLERNISTFVGQEEERIGVMILKNIAPNQIEVSSSGTDLIFCDKRSNHTIKIKGWNNSKSYRISTLEFDLGLEPITIRRLDKFSLHEVGKIQDLIGKASENYQNRDKYTPKVENDFKCLISVEGFERENKEPTYQCLGFSSLQDQVSFTENFCSLEQLTEFRDKSNSTQVSALSKNLQNDLSLNGYDQNIADKCSKLILTEENNQQSKISSMVKSVEKFTLLHPIAATSGRSLSEPKNRFNLGSCLGHRRKRDTNRCLALWKDIDKFNEEKSEKRNVNKIKINSEIFVYYIKGIEDESKRVQFIDLASQVEVTGKFQGLVNKIVRSREAISHLNKVGKVSGILMHGMIAKNALADFLSGDYTGVAINLGFIAGGRGLTKIVKVVNAKGIDFITDGKLLLGRSLKAASPFLARSTSAFVVYDLVNQIKELRSGDKDALIPVIGDSIYLGADAAEIGIEVAEAFEVLEGVSSVTGPIGTAIGAVVFIGTDIYMAVKRVDKIDEIVHLTGGERIIEGLRAFVGIKPEQYIEELMKKKQLNDQLVKQGLEYLKEHNNIQRYVFPTKRSVVDSCETFTREIVGMKGHFTVLKKERCKVEIQDDLDNVAFFDKEVSNVVYDRAKPDAPDEGRLFCLPTDPIRPESGGENAYLCYDTIGLDYQVNRTGDYTLIALGKGKDRAIGFKYSPNVFLVDDGDKDFTGGDKDDLFILVGNRVTGRLDGGGGNNTLNLAEFSLNENLNIKPDSRKNDSSISSSYNDITIKNMNIIYGRKGKQDIVDCGCDVRYIDGQGGLSNNSPDNITIPYCYRPSEKKIIVRPSSEINNLDQSSNGNFDYIILPDKGKANINIEPDYTFTRQRKHNFLFNYTLFDLASVDIKNIKDINHWHSGYGNMTHTIRNVTFSFLSPSLKDKSINEKFDITISDIPANASYILSDNTEIKIGKNNLYAIHSTDKTIDEVVQSYPTVADHLRMSLFVSTNNETVVIGHGNHDIINNNFLQKSHLIGSGGENVYVVTSGHEILDIENLPIPEAIIYDDFNKKNSIKDILDLRQLVRQVNGDLSIEPISKIIEDRNDLLIKLSISATGLKQDVVIVRLKDAFVNSWYRELQVILNNAPMKISSELELKPLPLIFDRDKEVIVVASQDVEEKSELIISKEAGQYTFLYSGYDLMITNVFNADMEISKFCTICLKDFYEQPKMGTLSIKFNDTEILLSNEIDKINNADSISDKLNMNGYISSIVKLQSFAPLEAASSNHPIRHKRHKDHSRHGDGMHRTRHKHHRVQKRNINYQDSHYYIDQSEIATNSAARPSSWINIVANTIVDAIKGISRFVYSPLKVELPEIPENGSDHSDTVRNPSNQYTNQFSSEVCVSNNVGLAFFLLQSFLDKKYPLPNLCSVTPKEALADTLNIVGEFEKTLAKTAKQSGVSVKGFDFFKVYLDIAGHVRNERYSQIPNTLYLITKEACPKNEKFLSILKGNIEKMFNEQQIVNSGYQPNYIADSKPRSYLSNTTVDKQLQRSYHAISS